MSLKIPATLFLIFCSFVSFEFVVRETFVNPYPIVCNLVADKIYLKDHQISNWKRICLRRAKLVTPFSSKKNLIQDINNVFELLKVSHLEIYDSSQVKNIWTGESIDTGLVGDFVDGEFVVFRVQAGSPAEKLGIKKGDIIEAINSENPSSWAAANEGGRYKVRRGLVTFLFQINKTTFKRDDSPFVEPLSRSIKLVTVPSFRADFFTSEKLEKLYQSFKDSNSLIVDLRGNAGGNFVAGLRFLSLFMCEEKNIGKLVKPRSQMSSKVVLTDDLDDEHQVDILENNAEIILKTYSRKSCFRGPVKVLIDGKTTSVAEMVAQAFKEIKASYIGGAPSRGQLLVGVWYPVSEVSPGVQISIPEAYYESQGGQTIEGQGVSVDRILYYNLPEMQRGLDSWVEAVAKKNPR